MAAADQDGPPLTELESLQLKANQVTDESLESTRRMIALCEDAQGAGAKTVDMLAHQGEQLDRVEGGIDNMNAEMKEAEKHLTGMEKWCGLCICPWNRRPKVRDVDGTWQSNNKSNGATKNQPAGKSGGGNVPDGGATGGNQQYVRRINNDAREDEMEENMQAVGGILGNLKSMATDMGAEIEKQNSQLDRINDKGGNVGMRIDSANKRTEDLLKK
jgi:synaptosomal-associated protein 25